MAISFLPFLFEFLHLPIILSAMFFYHNKSANNTFCHDLSAKWTILSWQFDLNKLYHVQSYKIKRFIISNGSGIYQLDLLLDLLYNIFL